MDLMSRTSFLIRRLQLQVAWLMEQELKKHGMTNGQYTVLGTIARHNGESSAEISRLLRVKPQALNEFIPPFEQRGLIERRGHPDNKRILCVYLTAKGKKLLEQCHEVVDALEAELHTALTPEELRGFRAVANKLSEAAHQMVLQRAKANDDAA
jgi:DNA-binding MarR family transcriptional regulator